MSNVKSSNERNVVRLLLDVKNNRYVVSTIRNFLQQFKQSFTINFIFSQNFHHQTFFEHHLKTIYTKRFFQNENSKCQTFSINHLNIENVRKL